MTKEVKIKFIELVVGAAIYLGVLFAAKYEYWNIEVSKELELAVFLLAYAVLAIDTCWQFLKNLRQWKLFDENLLMLIASGGALFVERYTEAVGAMLFFHIGKLIEALSLNHTKRSIGKFMDIRPVFANRKIGIGEEMVKPEELKLGQIIVIRPGEKVPVDAVVTSGFSNIDEKALTGEFRLRRVGPGIKVYSGSINQDGVLEARVDKIYEESTAYKIMSMVGEATENKSESENFADRFTRLYSPFVTLLGILTMILPPMIFSSQDPQIWVYRGLIFLVAACPCGLLVSVPLAFLGGIGAASRQGILIKGGNYLETLSRTETFIFDKTGTLTEGVFGVKDICPMGISAAGLLEIAAYAESYSNHPIALSLREAYEKGINTSRIQYIKEHSGLGIEAMIDGTRAYIGNARLMEVLGVDYQYVSDVGTVIHVLYGRRYVGYVVIADRIREDAKYTIDWLRQHRLESMMFTGDNESVANDVAKSLGIEYVYANQLPQDKVAQLEELMESQFESEKLAFVGDGINDALALARADVGIAMGGLGSDAALEAADIILMEDEPSRIVNAIRISRGTISAVRQNLYFAVFVKAILLVMAFLGLVSMQNAIIADMAVLLINLLNSFWVLKYPG